MMGRCGRVKSLTFSLIIQRKKTLDSETRNDAVWSYVFFFLLLDLLSITNYENNYINDYTMDKSIAYKNSRQTIIHALCLCETMMNGFTYTLKISYNLEPFIKLLD